VSAICANLFAAVAPLPLFDVILSNLPLLPVEALDLVDKAWFAGPDYRDIASVYEQARLRLAPGGRMYILLSSGSDLEAITALFEGAGFQARPVEERSHLFESVLIYELSAE
jgi:methylase of polypeptide subunit release factors